MDVLVLVLQGKVWAGDLRSELLALIAPDCDRSWLLDHLEQVAGTDVR